MMSNRDLPSDPAAVIREALTYGRLEHDRANGDGPEDRGERMSDRRAEFELKRALGDRPIVHDGGCALGRPRAFKDDPPRVCDCRTFAPWNALDALLSEVAAIDKDLRKEWWVNHGHPFGLQYGDDGEMQCGLCGVDFKREPMESLRARVFELRIRSALGGIPGPRQGEDVSDPAAAIRRRIELDRNHWQSDHKWGASRHDDALAALDSMGGSPREHHHGGHDERG
jgi:hypothetical protein